MSEFAGELRHTTLLPRKHQISALQGHTLRIDRDDGAQRHCHCHSQPAGGHWLAQAQQGPDAQDGGHAVGTR